MEVNALEAAYDALEGDLPVECAISVAHRCLVRVANLPDGRQRRDIVADATNELCNSLEANILNDATFSTARESPPPRPTTGIRSISIRPQSRRPHTLPDEQPPSTPTTSSARKRLRRKPIQISDDSEGTDDERPVRRPRRSPVVRENLVGDDADHADDYDDDDDAGDRESDDDYVVERGQTEPTRRSSRLAEVQHPPSPEPDPQPSTPVEPLVPDADDAAAESDDRSASGSPCLVLPVVRPKPEVPPRPLASDRISKTPVITADDEDTDEEVERSRRAHAPRPRVETVVIPDEYAPPTMHPHPHAGVIARPPAYVPSPPALVTWSQNAAGHAVHANMQPMHAPVSLQHGVLVDYAPNGLVRGPNHPRPMNPNPAPAARSADIEAELAETHARLNAAQEQENNWIDGLNRMQAMRARGIHTAAANAPAVAYSRQLAHAPGQTLPPFVPGHPGPHVAQAAIHPPGVAQQAAAMQAAHAAAGTSANVAATHASLQAAAHRQAYRETLAMRVAAEAATVAAQRNDLALILEQQAQQRLDFQLAQLERQQQLIETRRALIVRQQHAIRQRSAQARAGRAPILAAHNAAAAAASGPVAGMSAGGQTRAGAGGIYTAASQQMELARQAEIARLRRAAVQQMEARRAAAQAEAQKVAAEQQAAAQRVLAQRAAAKQAAAQRAAAEQVAAAQRAAAEQEAAKQAAVKQAAEQEARRRQAAIARFHQEAMEAATQPGTGLLSQDEVDRLCDAALGVSNAVAAQAGSASNFSVQNANATANVVPTNGVATTHAVSSSLLSRAPNGGHLGTNTERRGTDANENQTPAPREQMSSGGFVYNRVTRRPGAPSVKMELLAASSSDAGAPNGNGGGSATAGANRVSNGAGAQVNGTAEGNAGPSTPAANGGGAAAAVARRTPPSSSKRDLLNYDIEHQGKKPRVE